MAKKKPAQGLTHSGQTAKMIPAAPVLGVPDTRPPRVEGPRPIKVRATNLCYYDHGRRREGDVFFIEQRSHFNEKCMEYVDPQTPERVTGAGAALAQAHDEILASRMPGGNSDPTL